MQIRKLTDWHEWLESSRIIDTSFLHGWDEKKEEEKYRRQGAGEIPRNEEAWGAFDEDGRMLTSIVTSARKVMYEKQIIPISEVDRVASLPERRGGGNVRAMMAEVLRDFRARGDLFAVLHPFSFAFYRKFGFDLIVRSVRQKFPVGELKDCSCDLSVRQVRSADEMPALRHLYEQYIRDKNLADLRTGKDWEYRGNGEYGEPDWWSGGKQEYTYIFSDGTGDHAYLKFVFEPGPDGPFTGDLRATDIAYDSPQAFRSILGFIYGMRAKLVNVVLEIPDEIDLSVMVPECDHVQQTLEGHLMGRVLNVEKVLLTLTQPSGTGSYAIRVTDRFLPENTGIYQVRYQDGRTVSVEKSDGAYDLTVSVETFSQLAVGLYGLRTASFRPGTEIAGKEDILNQVFHKKNVYAS